jgi:MurNAc alpha-1-phosphate uridylyltransferase
MKAMVLAAGIGKRLLPFTKDMPKPLIEVGTETLLDRNINKILDTGITEIVINVSYLGDMIEKHLAENYADLDITVVKEQCILGTGGGILNALEHLGDEPFLLINADTYHEIPIDKLPTKTASAYLVGVPNPDHNKLGDFSIKNNKVTISESHNELTFAGISIINPIIFKTNQFPKAPFDIWNYVLKDLINQNKISGHEASELWIDVGSPERLSLAISAHKEEN